MIDSIPLVIPTSLTKKCSLLSIRSPYVHLIRRWSLTLRCFLRSRLLNTAPKNLFQSLFILKVQRKFCFISILLNMFHYHIRTPSPFLIERVNNHHFVYNKTKTKEKELHVNVMDMNVECHTVRFTRLSPQSTKSTKVPRHRACYPRRRLFPLSHGGSIKGNVINRCGCKRKIKDTRGKHVNRILDFSTGGNILVSRS